MHACSTVLSEILVTRVCGGSKISEIQEIQKILVFLYALTCTPFSPLTAPYGHLNACLISRSAKDWEFS